MRLAVADGAFGFWKAIDDRERQAHKFANGWSAGRSESAIRLGFSEGFWSERRDLHSRPPVPQPLDYRFHSSGVMRLSRRPPGSGNAIGGILTAALSYDE
jgi:hypothetical protein